MGYLRHHVIAVTSWDEENIKKAHVRAIEIFNSLVTEMVESHINGYISFFIAPDGSKEGWEESNTGDDSRLKFIKWLDEQANEDGSNKFKYAELFYGDDNGESKIVTHN